MSVGMTVGRFSMSVLLRDRVFDDRGSGDMGAHEHPQELDLAPAVGWVPGAHCGFDEGGDGCRRSFVREGVE